jgi:FAD/FMN-containing dehydrogenase
MHKENIQKFFRGEINDDPGTLDAYSRDASLFKVRPQLVIYPKDSKDLSNLVKYVSGQQGLNITMRAAGTDMSGGPLGESIIADVTRYMNHIGVIDERGTVVEPGAYYHDFEPKTLERNLILPCYPASKNLCALGGMIANNGAGEKTLRYGKMENFVMETKVIFSDGNEYEVKPLTKEELQQKMDTPGFEGDLYRNIFLLIENNKKLIEDSKPKVSKNSAGYYLWNIWQGDKFDLNKLLVGSQGTLGIITEAKVRLVPVEPISRLFVIFLPNLDHLADLVNEILPTEPESIESYDDASIKLAMRFMPKYLFRFIPEAIMALRGGLPKLVMLVEYTGKTEEEVENKLNNLKNKINHFGLQMRAAGKKDSEKYWAVRRESFNLLRKHIHNARTAPFVDDVVVKPEDMPAFLPRMREILDKEKMVYTIAGHAGNGNFHIIPLMDMRDQKNVDVIKRVGEQVYSLVKEFHGSITGEHNDGIVRTPYLGKMYSKEMLELFRKTKEIFDPKNIFNPGKKVGGTIDYLTGHIALE